LNDAQSTGSSEEHTVVYPSDAVHGSKMDAPQENLTAPLCEHDDDTVEAGLDSFPPIVPWKTYFFAVHPDEAFRYLQTYFMPASKNSKEDEEIHLIKSNCLKDATPREPELPDMITSPLHTDTSLPFCTKAPRMQHCKLLVYAFGIWHQNVTPWNAIRRLNTAGCLRSA